MAEGAAAGLLLGYGLGGQEANAAMAGVGGYLVADLLYLASCDIKNRLRNGQWPGACEQPASVGIEMPYNAIDNLVVLAKGRRHG